jgi:hypothetical protein
MLGRHGGAEGVGSREFRCALLIEDAARGARISLRRRAFDCKASAGHAARLRPGLAPALPEVTVPELMLVPAAAAADTLSPSTTAETAATKTNLTPGICSPLVGIVFLCSALPASTTSHTKTYKESPGTALATCSRKREFPGRSRLPP